MVWCLYLFHDYFTLNCNSQLYLSLILTQLSVSSKWVHRYQPKSWTSLLSQVKELNFTDKNVCMNSRAFRSAAEFGVWPKDEIFLDNASLEFQIKSGVFERGRETHALEGNFNKPNFLYQGRAGSSYNQNLKKLHRKTSWKKPVLTVHVLLNTASSYQNHNLWLRSVGQHPTIPARSKIYFYI